MYLLVKMHLPAEAFADPDPDPDIEACATLNNKRVLFIMIYLSGRQLKNKLNMHNVLLALALMLLRLLELADALAVALTLPSYITDK